LNFSDKHGFDIENMTEFAHMDFYELSDQRINSNSENIKVVTSIYQERCIAGGSIYLEQKKSQNNE